MDFWQRNTTAKSQKMIMKFSKMFNIDFKALNILFNYKWNFDDQNCYGVKGDIPEIDFIYGKEKGVLKDPKYLSHEQVLSWLLSSREKVSKQDVATAFISSLNSSRSDHACLIGAYSCFQSMSLDVFNKALAKDGINGLKENSDTYDVNSMQFYRFRGWSLCQDHIIFASLLFEEFVKEELPVVTEADHACLHNILDALRNLSGDTTLTQVQNSLKGIVTGKKGRLLLETLALCDILQPENVPSIRDDYYYLSYAPLPSHFYSKEWRYPMCHWKGRHGVNEEAVKYWFPGFEK